MIWRSSQYPLYTNFIVDANPGICANYYNLIPKPELWGVLRGFPYFSPPFGVTSAEVAIICPEECTHQSLTSLTSHDKNQWPPHRQQRQEMLLMTPLNFLGPMSSGGRNMLCHPIICNYGRTFLASCSKEWYFFEGVSYDGIRCFSWTKCSSLKVYRN